MTEWATYYNEIPQALSNNESIRSHAIDLIDQEPILGKALEGGTRTEDFRGILSDFFRGDIDHTSAEERVLQELPHTESRYRHETHSTFNDQWAERLIRAQMRRFYNQSVLELLQEQGESHCFVPHSPREDRDKKCTQRLAGGQHPISDLLQYLYSQQRHGNWNDGVTIPNRPNCTHTVIPVYEADN
jgi:hemerythrin